MLDTAEPDEDDRSGGTRAYTPKKGHATPKRREAEKGRRQPVTAPRDRKEAYRQAKDRQRRDRTRARTAAARGDDRYLSARDKGPVRRLARDYIDSHRMLSQYFMWASLGIVLIALVPIPAAQLLVYAVWIAMMLAVIMEGVTTARRVKRLVADRLPDEPARGVGLYAAMRALQIRRFRMPEPRVDIGDPV